MEGGEDGREGGGTEREEKEEEVVVVVRESTSSTGASALQHSLRRSKKCESNISYKYIRFCNSYEGTVLERARMRRGGRHF